MTLTHNDSARAELELLQAEEYDVPKLLTITEQVALDLFSNANDYQRVASTVEAPILDETNILYKVDGIDDDALFAVLTLHKQYNRTAIPVDEKYADIKDTEYFRKFTTITGNLEETRTQSKFGNIPLSVVDLAGKSDENLEDIMWPNYKEVVLYSKQKKLKDNMMITLKNLWDEYHRLEKEKIVATWDKYIWLERRFKQVFNDIKKIEALYNRLTEGIKICNWKRDILPKMDNLLIRFTNWQQVTLKKWDDPMITWEDACQRSWFYNKDIELYNEYQQSKDNV